MNVPAVGPGGSRLGRYLPILDWARGYQRADLVGDLIAGLIVAIMLVPQSMAYALLAGLPPQVGLYASIAPLLAYALLGSSRTLAVGPVAIVSLLVAGSAAALAEPGSPEYLGVALSLALLSGLIQLAMGLLRLGQVVNFMSHPVISGFTSAAAITIGLSQVKTLLGLKLPRSEAVWDLLGLLAAHLGETRLVTLAVGLGAIAILLGVRGPLQRRLLAAGMAPGKVLPLAKAGPLLAVLAGIAALRLLPAPLAAQLEVVGEIPAGLPPVTWPGFDLALWQRLLPAALVISFVGFLESFAVAKSLATRRREPIEANQELIGLGAANLAAALTGGYPVTGGFSRSVVNYDAGARTGMASIFTAGLVALTVWLLTPLLHDLPKAVLAAIVIVAVAKLVDVAALRWIWRYNRADGMALVATFLLTLGLGVELGVIAGAGLALALHTWRSSVPHVAVVGRVPGTEHYRNIERHAVETDPRVLAVRIDESLYFPNAQWLETVLQRGLASRPEARHLLLIFSAVNFVDASALESLERTIDALADAGVTLHLAEVKGPVMDRLQRVDFADRLGAHGGRIFLSTHAAMLALTETEEVRT